MNKPCTDPRCGSSGTVLDQARSCCNDPSEVSVERPATSGPSPYPGSVPRVSRTDWQIVIAIATPYTLALLLIALYVPAR